MIELKHVSAGYPGAMILRDFSLTVPRGKITTLIGPNGCGKTTLLKAMCRLLPCAEGEILFSGKPQNAFSPREFARLAAVLPQARNIPALPAEQFVAHGRYPHLAFGRDLTQKDREIIRRAMEETGVLHLKGKELTELSGGERQRVYLAMALAQDTEILFLDEPTTYLDVGQKYEMMELIRRINESGRTVVMVLHDLPLAFSHSHRIALMEAGKLLLSGTPEEVFASGLADRVFGVKTEKLSVGGKTEYLFLPPN